MKPSFALNITDSSIGLLHRTARGWLQVGETAFDTADLAEALGYLRGSALGLSPGGLTTKLVLPNSQIKYLELDAPGPDDANRRTQIRAALVGRTPYNVEDLVFDWSGTGAKVKVAVLARETLDEAEAFATEHRFNPVSFVGLPSAGDFNGEPWFGPTKLASTLLEKGEKVDRDAEPVQVAARDLPKSHPGALKTAPDGAADADAAKPPAEGEKTTRAQRRAAAAATSQQASETSAVTVSDAALGATAVPDAAIAPALPESRDDSSVKPAAWSGIDPILPTTLGLPDTPVGDVKASADHPATPSASVADNQAFPEVAIPDVALNASLPVDDDLPPAPSAASMAAFASRRGPDLPLPKQFGGSAIGTNGKATYTGTDAEDAFVAKSAPPPLSRPKVGGDIPPNVAPLRSAVPAGVGADTDAVKSSAQKPNTAFVTAPSIPGSRKRKALPQGAITGAGDPRKSLTKPGGTFASSKSRGKPKYLGLILTALLLIFLALIAAWSSFFMASNDVSQNGTAVVSAPVPDQSIVVAPANVAPEEVGTADVAPEDVATPDASPIDLAPANEVAADVPAIDDEMLADSQDPADFALADTGAAAGDVNPAPDLAATDLTTAKQPDQAAQAVPAPEPAPLVAAATDSPNATPLSEAQDEIFLAAIDAPPLALDPLALPAPVATVDALPLPQLEPPPFGTVYQFDTDGRIRPTPEGIITPEGVRLVAGKPTVLPPPRPDAPAIAASVPPTELPPTELPAASATAAPATAGAITAAVAEAIAAPFPSDPALAAARPRTRPAGIAPQGAAQAGDGAALADPSTTQVSGLRPLARPAAVLAAGEAARLSTAAASLTSQAEQAAAIEAAVQVSFQPDPNASRLAVAVSRRPAARPQDMSRAVEAAVAAAVRAPEPQAEQAQAEADSEPEVASAAPAIPTRASVAKQATYVNAINLSKINLIGVYGSKSSPYALIRQANGRYKKVKVGDSIDGGKVAAIGASEVRYQKSGRMISLKMPRT